MAARPKIRIQMDPKDAISFEALEHAESSEWWASVYVVIDGRYAVEFWCETPDQVRAFIPGFCSKAEKAANEAAVAPLVAEAPVVARPFQVGDKVHVLRVPEMPEIEPYDSEVLRPQYAGRVLVRSRSAGDGWNYEGERVWEVALKDLELIAPAEEPAEVSA